MAIAILALLSLCIIWIVLSPERIIFDYRITSTAVQVVLFNIFPVLTISFTEIFNIKKLGRFEFFGLSALHFENRIFRPAVLIERKKAFFPFFFTREIIITPANRDQFYDELMSHLSQ